MFLEPENTNEQLHQETNLVRPVLDFEAEQNLLGFFSLLLEVDKRVNPQNYQNNK